MDHLIMAPRKPYGPSNLRINILNIISTMNNRYSFGFSMIVKIIYKTLNGHDSLCSVINDSRCSSITLENSMSIDYGRVKFKKVKIDFTRAESSVVEASIREH